MALLLSFAVSPRALQASYVQTSRYPSANTCTAPPCPNGHPGIPASLLHNAPEGRSRRLKTFQAGREQHEQRSSTAVRCGASESRADPGEAQGREAPAARMEETGLTPFIGGMRGQLHKLPERSSTGLVPVRVDVASGAAGGLALQTMGKEAAWGLVAQAVVGAGSTGWVTGSGLEGPSAAAATASEAGAEGQLPLEPLLTRSPRRRMRVKFTCNKCGARTMRAINPLAYTEGTVFVQCKGCEVFHKLVDNLGLFHELGGPIYGPAYRTPDVMYHQPYDPFASMDSEDLL